MDFQKSISGCIQSLTALVAALIMLLHGCASPLPSTSLPERFSPPPDPAAIAWQPLRDNLPADYSQTSWFDVQAIGPEALRWRLAMMDTAVHTLDAQYFLWKDDAVGSLLLERLLQAADRGVRVRLLLDDSFLSGEDDLMLAVDAHPNVEMRIFNPFAVRSDSMLLRYLENLNDNARINHRMHNKLLIADSEVAIVGGRNIADEYFGFDRQLNFRTFDVLTTGAVLSQITVSLDRYWNSDQAYPVSMVNHRQVSAEDLASLRQRLRSTAAVLDGWLAGADVAPEGLPDRWAGLARRLLSGAAMLHQDDPDIMNGLPVQAADGVVSYFRRTREEAMSISAYLIPSDALLQVAQELTQRGVRIRVLTNSLASNNHIAAHTAYRHRRRQIVEAGVELHELQPDAPGRAAFEAPGFTAEHVGLHAKLLVLDGRYSFVGTINADPRSMVLNTEVSLLIDSTAVANRILAAFAPDFLPQNSWQVRLDEADGRLRWHGADGVLERQPAGGHLRRLTDFFFGLLPIDEQM
jgi:putative cardiolipin synthase